MRKIIPFFLEFIFGLFLPTGIFKGTELAAQAKTKAVQESYQHEVTVTLKLVQVFVADRQGNPALDLDKPDFLLYDNGKLQTITDFERHFLSAPETQLEETRPSPGRHLPFLMNRKFIFLIDYESNDLEGIAKSRNAARQFIDTRVQPDDEIALFSYSSFRGLTLHEYLTSDHERVRRALKKTLEIPEISEGWDSYANLGHSAGGSRKVGTGKDVVRFSSHLQALAKTFRHIPGQKNFILFSRGLGMISPGSPAWDFWVAMGKELASANCRVFSVNTTTGVDNKINVSAEVGLKHLSKLTGGKYFPDVNFYSRIAEDIQNVASNYYILGYSIESTWDGRFHDIKVEVKKPGYKVYAQGGYFNPLPFHKLSVVEKHLHLLDLALGEKATPGPHMNFPLIALPFSDQDEPMTYALLSSVRQDNVDIFFLEFALPELESGRYPLHIFVEDAATKSSSETTSDLQVR